LIQRAAHHSNNHPRQIAFLAHAYATSGNHKEARKLLHQLEEMTKEKYVPALVELALGYAALGEIETAFHWLNRAYEERAGMLVWLFPDPAADPLRSDPRFQDLMRRVGLKEKART